jgi:chemotaxis response regulator CheB
VSNDLLFSILPREGKVPVVVDEKVKRVSKETRAKNLSEDEKETHDEERLISEQEQYKVHEKAPQQEQDAARQQPDQQSDEQSAAPETDKEEELLYDSHGETPEHHHDPDAPHIDIYE